MSESKKEFANPAQTFRDSSTNEDELNHKFGLRSAEFRTPLSALDIPFVLIRVHLWLALLCAALVSFTGHAQDMAAKGREIFKKERECVITIQVVVKSKMGFRSGEGRESKQEISGTVIDS